jgi:hypothetical protein
LQDFSSYAPDPGESTNPGENTDSGEDGDPAPSSTVTGEDLYTEEFYDTPTDLTTETGGEDLYFFDVLDDCFSDDGQTPDPAIVTPCTHIRRWMEKWVDLAGRTPKFLSFLMRRQIKFKVQMQWKENQHHKYHSHSSLVFPTLTETSFILTGMNKDRHCEGLASVSRTTIVPTLAINKMIDVMGNNYRMFWNFRGAMTHDTFGASYARQRPDDDYVEGRSDVRQNWSLCLLDFLKERHVKFKMKIPVFGGL